jgi:hypothetical protein
MELILEIFVCACEKAGKIRYVTFQHDITDRGCDPNIILSEELGKIGLYPENTCQYAHSTSWRYDSGRTVITYLVWSKLRHLSLFETRVLAPAGNESTCSGDCLKPRSNEINEVSVLSHGLRHFRFLIDQKGPAVFGNGFTEELLSAIGSLEPAMAGRIN